MDSISAHRGEGQQGFRLFHSESGLNLASDYELGKPPRGPQKSTALIQMGISLWMSERAALEKNEGLDGKLGDSLAVIVMDGSRGVWYAPTFGRDHVTVWGRRADLEACVRDIFAV